MSCQKMPWDCYPRPQLRRDSYVNLNGIWEFHVSQIGGVPSDYESEILVPFCPESKGSGLEQAVLPGSYLYYRRRFTLPEGFCRGRVLLHIGAADQIATVYVNQKEIGTHEGGYTAFTLDITEALEDTNELVIRCLDDLRDTRLPYGKQSLHRGGMWYTPVSGLWQTVWLESVPEQYIERLRIRTDESVAEITVTPALDGKLLWEGGEVPLRKGKAVLQPEQPHRWSPEDPYLYEFALEAGEDRVESYFALRSITVRDVNGLPRLCLNGKPYFFHGLLDQGYWPQGIYTPEEPECYTRDILSMKELGFNTLRKHIKVEPEEFYYQCDRLGMVVMQDMVNNGDYRLFRDTLLPGAGFQKQKDHRRHKDKATREAFLKSMEETVRQLENHPSILFWTVFNEGWGQFEADECYERLRTLDPSRIIDTTSGWFRGKKSDVDSRHIYFGPWHLKPSDKPLILSEFGGYACAVKGHIFDPKKAFGYRICRNPEHFQRQIEKLYRKRILPTIPKGLCAAIITQVSDVEEEINGFLTYDRQFSKADPGTMAALSQELRDAQQSS